MYLTVIVVSLLSSSTLTYSLSAASGECNGRGHRQSNTNEQCVCDSPYYGAECERCTDGFYGQPVGGDVCYLPCSGSERLLHNFSSAGVGVQKWWLSQRPSIGDQPYCLWVIAPLINKANDSLRNDQLSFYTTINDYIFNPPATDLRMSLRFKNDQTSPCHNETVLIYTGFPQSLNPYNLSHLTPSALYTSGSLVGSFTGTQLVNRSFSVFSTVLTVVYFHSTSAPSSQLQGFNLSIDIDRLSTLVENTSFPVNVSDAPATTSQPGHSLPDNGSSIEEEDNLVYLSTLVSSPSSTTLPLSFLQNLEGDNTTADNLLVSTLLRQLCPGRRHHSSIYDPCSNTLWIYGGLDHTGQQCQGLTVVNLSLALNGHDDHDFTLSDLAGEMREEGVVRWIENSDGGAPRERYLHTASLLPCQQSLNGSQMLMFGGYTSSSSSLATTEASGELWLYSLEKDTWTQLESAPSGYALAGHSATLTPDQRLVVIGGVNRDQRISPRTLLYHLVTDSWEVLPVRTLDLPGVYGHSATYDATINSVLVYGGYMYTRPQAVVSSSLHSLDMSTLTWRRVQLAHEVPSRMFHSMVVISNLLVIHGGLLSQQNQPGLEGVCPSNDVTIIDLTAACNGKPALTLPVNKSSSTYDGGHWGHSLTTNGEYTFVVGGGQDITDHSFISLLHLPTELSCSLAQTVTGCQAIPGCSVCVDNLQTDQLIACYNASEAMSNSTAAICTECGGFLSIEDTSVECERLSRSCEQFESCGSCLSSDLALEMGCVWYLCKEQCVSPPSSSASSLLPNSSTIEQEGDSQCSYTTVNSTQSYVCILDLCALPSCTDCLAERNCRWLPFEIRENPIAFNGIVVATQIPEWGCYSVNVNNGIIRKFERDFSVSRCPAPCSSATSCSSCLLASSPTGGQERCVWAEYSQECLSVDSIPLTCSLGMCGPILSASEPCPTACVSRETCQLCLIDPSCVWVSNVAYGVPRCIELSELRAGTVDQLTEDEVVVYYDCPSGVSCYHYCHGNSERCVETGRVLEQNVEPNLLFWVNRQPGDEEVMCLECGGFSQGTQCESCLPGYFNSNTDQGLVTCQRCSCNGHDADDCDPNNGLCTCQNNTRSVPCEGSICTTFSQCSLCEPNFAGDPRNNGQCYKQLLINTISNFSLAANQSTSFYFGHSSGGLFFSNVDVRASIVVSRGLLDVYISTDSSDVSVSLNRETWAHQLTFRPGVNILTRSSVGSLSPEALNRHIRSTTDTLQQQQRTSDGRLVIDRKTRTLQHSSISPTPGLGLYHFVVDERLTLVVPHNEEDFALSDFFITVFVRENTEFFFYYRQDLPRLNLFVFFCIFNCFFLLSTSLVIYVYRVGNYIVKRRRRRRERARQERRANRPLVKVVVYFGETKQSSVSSSTMEMTSKRGLRVFGQSSEKNSVDTGVFKSPLLELVTKDRKEDQVKKKMVVSRSHTKTDGDIEVAELADKCTVRGEMAGDGIELETHKTAMEPSMVTKTGKQEAPHKKKKEKKYQILFADDIKEWPVCMQPTADEAVCLSTVLVQLPLSKVNSGSSSSSSRRRRRGVAGRNGQLCTGSALLDYPKVALEEKEKGEKSRKRLKFMKKNQLAPAPNVLPSSSTTQV